MFTDVSALRWGRRKYKRKILEIFFTKERVEDTCVSIPSLFTTLKEVTFLRSYIR